MEVLRAKLAGTRIDINLLNRAYGAARAFPVFVDPASRCRMIQNGDLLIRLAEGTKTDDIADLLASEDLALVRAAGSSRMHTYLLRCRDIRTCDPMKTSRRLMDDSRIVWAEPDFAREVHKFFTPNDTYYNRQQTLHNTGQNGATSDADVDGPEAWDITRGTNALIIAIIDDGGDGAHPDNTIAVNVGEYGGGKESNGVDDDFNGRIDDYRGWDFVDNDNFPFPSPGDSHGVACAGVAAAIGHNGAGMAGATHLAKVLPVCIFHGEVLASDVNFGEAISYGADYADIISCSWGGGAPSSFISAAIDDAVWHGRGGRGCPVFCATGNDASTWGRIRLPMTGLISGTYRLGFSFYCYTTGDRGGIDDVYIINSADNYWHRTDLMADQTFEGVTFPPTGWMITNELGAALWSRSSVETKTGSAGSYSARSPNLIAGEFSPTLLTPALPLTQFQTLVFDNSLYLGTDGILFIDLYDASGNFIEEFASYDTYWTPVYSSVTYPASHSNSIAVGASTDCDRRSDYSCYGAGLAFVAPSSGGINDVPALDVAGINGYVPGDYDFTFGGTSAATPLAAGIAALMLSKNPTLSVAALRALLIRSCDKIGGVTYAGGEPGAGGVNTVYGYGRINAYRALTNTPIWGVNSAPTNIAISGATVPENLPAGTTAGVFSTQDPDLTNTFAYTLVAGTGDADNGAFTISSSNLLAAVSFDYEGRSNYSIRVRSLDQGGLSTQKVFAIQVGNVNELPTNIVISGASVAENLPASVVAGAFSTQDPDFGNTFTYGLVAGTGGTDNASFAISGSNLLTAAAFNYEVKSAYSIRVQTADQGGQSTQLVFAITVSNVNERATNIVISSTNVAENLPAGTVVGAFSAQDPDFTNTFTYALLAGPGDTDNGVFTISGSNLLTAAAFNFEVKSNYSIRVQSADQGGLSTQKVFAIRVSNAEDPPTNIVISSSSVLENLPTSATVGAFSTQDPDPGNTFVYTLVAGTGSGDNGAFTISGSNLLTASSFNYEVKTFYNIRVQSTDPGDQSTQKVFTIIVNNVNERPTGIVRDSGGFLYETGVVGSFAALFSTQDPDGPNNFVYALVEGEGGEDNGSFAISGVAQVQGTLLTAALLNFETKANLSVRVQTTDPGGLSTQKVFVIVVGNWPENPTNILITSENVAENLPAGTAVGVLSTQDPDFTNTFTYALVAGTGGTDNGAFTIGDSNLLTAAAFNFESQSNYSIRVLSTDHSGLATQKVFAVNVSDVEEPAPVMLGLDESVNESVVIRWSSLTNHVYTIHVSTNLLAGYSVLQSNVLATPEVNSYTDTFMTVPVKFWKISTDP